MPDGISKGYLRAREAGTLSRIKKATPEGSPFSSFPACCVWAGRETLVTELAWHSLFIRHMLRRPERDELDAFIPEFTVINSPSFRADPKRHNCRSETVIAMNFDRKLILIGGTEYAGENKKSVFTLLNYLLPEKGIMPMHCSANHAPGNPVDTAVFFGLSGTGKTTLSADPTRILIGDDEHGWSDRGTFNFEGGCYAKTINLSLKPSQPTLI